MNCSKVNNDNVVKSYVTLCPTEYLNEAERVNSRKVLYTVAYRIFLDLETVYYWVDSPSFTSYNPNFKTSNGIINQVLVDRPSQFDNIICFNSLKEAEMHFKYVKDKIKRLIDNTKYHDRPVHLRDYEDYRWTIMQVVL